MSEIDSTLDILARLVAFDTTSRNSNLALIEWVEAFLTERGVASRRVPNADGSKTNLFALIGPEVEGGVVLSGHTDVVPVDGQPWSSDPWTVAQHGGKLYGRGVADMKSFLALALAHVDRALAAPLKRPILLAFSYDEEVGCLGAPALIDAILHAAPRPALAIIGEPTMMKVVSGHKGVRSFIVKVTGREAHSSMPLAGVSAIMEAVTLMGLVSDMAAESLPPSHLYREPYPTMTIGKVEGGTAANILARRCDFVWDLRTVTSQEADVFEARFREAAALRDAEIKRRFPEGGVAVLRRSNTPELKVDPESPAELFARAVTGDNQIRTVAYAAEAGLFQRAGIPAVICGPGSIEQAHQPNEWIERSQIEAGVAFMQRLIERLSV